MFPNLKNDVFGFGGNLSLKLKRFFRQESYLDQEAVLELEAHLLSGDLGAEVTRRLLAEIEKKEQVPEKALFKGLLDILKPRQQPLRFESEPGCPFTILVVGVNGSGKTTTVAKLARLLTDKDYSVTLAAADTFRAAAQQQLSAWAKDLNIPIVVGKSKADPSSVVYESYKQAEATDADVLIIDTAGRLHTQQDLMDELGKIKRVLDKLSKNKPYETLMVIDSTMGRNVVRQTEFFNKQIGVSGLVITKLDGTAKGGVILEIADKFDVAIRYVGTGEGPNDLSDFNPESFVSKLLEIEAE